MLSKKRAWFWIPLLAGVFLILLAVQWYLPLASDETNATTKQDQAVEVPTYTPVPLQGLESVPEAPAVAPDQRNPSQFLLRDHLGDQYLKGLALVAEYFEESAPDQPSQIDIPESAGVYTIPTVCRGGLVLLKFASDAPCLLRCRHLFVADDGTLSTAGGGLSLDDPRLGKGLQANLQGRSEASITLPLRGPDHFVPAKDQEPAQVEVEFYASVEVRVVDTENAPLEGVKVISTLRVPYSGASINENRSYDEPLTDASGFALISRSFAGEFQIRASKEGYFQSDRDRKYVLKPGMKLSGIQIVMDRGEVIAGEVVDEQGVPVSGASVRLGHQDSSTSQFNFHREVQSFFARKMTTDADGRFFTRAIGSRPVIRQELEKGYSLFVSTEDGRVAVSDLTEPYDSQQIVVHPPTRHIIFDVRSTEDQSPIANAIILIDGSVKVEFPKGRRAAQTLRRYEYQVTTDDVGKADIYLPEGPAFVTAHKAGWADSLHGHYAPPDLDRIGETLEIRMSPTSIVTLQAQNSDVVSFAVRSSQLNEAGEIKWEYVSHLAAVDGKAVLPNLKPGKWLAATLTKDGSLGMPQEFETRGDLRELTLHLNAATGRTISLSTTTIPDLSFAVVSPYIEEGGRDTTRVLNPETAMPRDVYPNLPHESILVKALQNPSGLYRVAPAPGGTLALPLEWDLWGMSITGPIQNRVTLPGDASKTLLFASSAAYMRQKRITTNTAAIVWETAKTDTLTPDVVIIRDTWGVAVLRASDMGLLTSTFNFAQGEIRAYGYVGGTYIGRRKSSLEEGDPHPKVVFRVEKSSGAFNW